MRIAILSDIHGNLQALAAVPADIRTRGADLTVNLGDILSGPLQPAATADLLMSLDLPTLRGNHERALLGGVEDMSLSDRHAHEQLSGAHRAWIAGLPATLTLPGEVFLCHGTPGSDLHYFLEEVDATGCHAAAVVDVTARADGCKARLILCGHSHMPRIVRLDDGRQVLNPGSVGLQAYSADLPLPHRIEAGTPHARYALAELTPAGWQAQSFAVEYDWDAAAQEAYARGRPDWALALRTGHV